jgi:hypothetical protein
VLNAIGLYELLAARTQYRFEDLPTIERFMNSWQAKREVKGALLDLYSSA